ncbi:hypothetical protein [Nitrosomonas sp. Nm34]|uniref:hypothetical protein n=1 Tax=Nitrosomonas sp. Nm34 TaxID=1881055 RepID=UPI0008E1EDB4|nr:hypothetical protein [Nitrosomonas sp. Nm34]SFI30290.1 hypothetical protein SAMN05428978_10051 [Nitrosomonas sp. Nm34]
MNFLRHIIEPSRLLMTWQPLDLNAPSCTRRVIGEICQENSGQIVFRYLKDNPDFEAARKAGFKDFPAFRLKHNEVRQGVIESLLRRLPPRNREDFAEFLAQHRLPYPFNYSDMALLGYTGARLPSDGFALVPDFSECETPCDYLMEVAGIRHTSCLDVSNIHLDDPVEFAVDQNNPVDQDALLVICQGQKIGYVNRAFRASLHHWLRQYHVSAAIEKLNGKSEHPLVYVRINAN